MRKIHKLIAVGALLLGASSLLQAQPTIYDVNRVMGSDLNGTARFVGMGGAMGALGGDISTMGTNPAGIGIYRSNDVMVSFGFNNTGASASNGASVDKFHGSFDNAGFVFSSKIGNETALRYVNFGFNYHRQKSFDRNTLTHGVFSSSQTLFMADLVNWNGDVWNPFIPDDLDAKDAYYNPELPWLGILGWRGHLLTAEYEKGTDGKEKLKEYAPYYVAGDAVGQTYKSKESGGLHSYDFNVAFNFSDRFYLGATLGVYSVDYARTSLYTEDFTDKDGVGQGYYDLSNDYRVDGSGVDFKLGFIWRPFESSSFRIGGAISTPTFFSMTEYSQPYLNYQLGKIHGVIEPVDEYGSLAESEFKYHIVTPWKFNVNMGYTIGSVAALGFEYEYSNYSSAKLKNDDGTEMGQTQDIKNMMEGVHTIRAGAEFKLAPEFAFRVGYNHISPSLKSGAFKYIPGNSMRTDTEFANPGATNNYTLGFGYRGQTFYADIAYQYSMHKDDFYSYYYYADDGYTPLVDAPTSIKRDRHQVLVTLGMRF